MEIFIFRHSTVFMVGCVCILAFYWSDIFNNEMSEDSILKCRTDYTDDAKIKCRPACGRGSFSLDGMKNCHPWLTCDDIQEVRSVRLLFQGVVKNIYLAHLSGNLVIMSNLSNPLYKTDFDHHIQMLKEFSPNENIVQLIGHCNHSVITEYHKLGSALNVDSLTEKFNKWMNLTTRLLFCIYYVEIIAFLHNSPSGTRVMCDSNSLSKTLSQYLITEDFRLILNDLDALPRVDHNTGQKIKCGHVGLFGDFVAPEQRWLGTIDSFDDDLMPSYDEKSDIWKIPDVCNSFLGYNRDSDIVKFMLFDVHKQCKSELPHERPTANSVLKRYNEVLQEIRDYFSVNTHNSSS